MTTTVEKSILVNVPVSVAYNQWTQFEEFPHFMGGVTSVTQQTDDRLRWVAEIAGVKRQWEAKILEQVPDRKVAWAATEGATNAGSVTFEDLGGGQCRVHLHLEYEPEGLVEKVGDKLNVVENQAEGDLDRFKAFIEDEGYASGAWRGTLNAGAGVDAGVEHASASRGSSGKAGISGKAAAAGVGLAAAAAAAVVAGQKSSDDDEVDVVNPTTPPPPVTPPVTATPPATATTTPPVTGTVPDPVEPVRLEDDRGEQPGAGAAPANPVVADGTGADPDPVLDLERDRDRDDRA
ncbi:SRPBCC family protein [Cellulomonas sp. ATA003]|uniref:SRPBCC family protein n=1 Tax=Cellulomonas sp. ATA003 TaxID=3073064 RepID=UPI0028732A79|nr:SRPBCC family protein [Cellulomonas sp. ATA003]WNB86651.1 SRPBCC family protein [Cellulomonas sp. ATA003]